MKLSLPTFAKILAVLAACAACTAPLLRAHDSSDPLTDQAVAGILVPVNEKTDAAWLVRARADYPLDSCSVSGDKFDGGDMGKPQDYVYQQAGKPDRLVRFCCNDCPRDFKKDPAKYLKVIDDAAAAKAAAKK